MTKKKNESAVETTRTALFELNDALELLKKFKDQAEYGLLEDGVVKERYQIKFLMERYRMGCLSNFCLTPLAFAVILTGNSL